MGKKNKSWVTPLMKQCFVSAGVCLNLMSHALVVGSTSALLQQLVETKLIVEESSLSWIASIHGVAITLATFIAPFVINRCGRRIVSIMGALAMIAAWLTVAAAHSTPAFLCGRFIQGLSMGFTGIVGPIVIGECTTPKYRGVLLTMIPLAFTLGILISHTLGAFLSFRLIAVVYAVEAVVDLLMSLYSPESPSFLALCGRLDECRKAFHWLRGFDEDEELEKLIKTAMTRKPSKIYNEGVSKWITDQIYYVFVTLKKKEVYKPVVLMLHLHAFNVWSGCLAFDVYANKVITSTVGSEISYALVVVSLDVQRVLSSACGMILIKKFRRRLVLYVAVIAVLVSYSGAALYMYLRSTGVVMNYPVLGFFMLHLHMLICTVCIVPLPNIIDGEILPLEHRSFCGMLSMLFFSMNATVAVKNAPRIFTALGLHGACVVNAVIVAYSVIIPLLMLPETKDRTLLDIEEEFRGKPLFEPPSELKLCAEAE